MEDEEHEVKKESEKVEEEILVGKIEEDKEE